MEAKQWWKSKTVWLNVVSLLLEFTQIFSGTQVIPAGTLTIITNVLNVGLRFLTKAPIK